MSDKNLKVTDRRMFTPDGVLREEFQHLEGSQPSEPRPAEPSPPQPPAAESARPVEPQPVASRPVDPGPPSAARPAPAPPEPEEATTESGAGFPDLIRLLAEHASVYLMQSRSAPPGAASEHLELAGLHVDLLEVLRHKTRGNLAPQEQAMLDDALRQLRAGLVGLRG